MKKRFILIAIILLSALLRLYHLSVVPPSLYWDEASLGYNAYSISESLRDEHGEFLPLTRFIAFGDYKPPGYIYAAAFFIKIFGLSEISVRLPSAIAGILLTLLAYLLTGEFFKTWKRKEKVALIAGLFVAISPWSLQVSRAGFEANLATTLSGYGLYFFLKASKNGSWSNFVFSAVLLSASIYTFNSHRLFIPLILITLILVFIKNLLKHWKSGILFGIVLAILLLPLVPYFASRESTLRFAEVGWINDVSLVEKSNITAALDGNTWWAGLIHNRRTVYAGEFLKHFTDHFKGSFLFFSGDTNPKLSIQTVGQLYWVDLFLIPLGAFFLAKRSPKTGLVILLWTITALVPAALARETPHALRILQILPIPMSLAAVGLVYFPKKIFLSNNYLLATFFSILSFTLMLFYLHDYHVHYPKNYALDWQYGYKQMVQYVGTVAGQFDKVQVTGKYGRPYIYFLFYLPFPPENYWQTRKVDRDWYGFWYVHAFDKFDFTEDKNAQSKVLYVTEPEGTDPNAIILKQIYDPSGNLIFNIYHL